MEKLDYERVYEFKTFKPFQSFQPFGTTGTTGTGRIVKGGCSNESTQT
jgi:hypothetical protein